ncbi:hypothetical protein [uncultured Dubosiella sp.]|uniref:hypothetical protein n=1 Tax=uncultured Dubosiella sp. TaxID=1937011 RepID=UPI00271215C5|nr:hypothetical protein [uncultured Dubosiella sp.]
MQSHLPVVFHCKFILCFLILAYKRLNSTCAVLDRNRGDFHFLLGRIRRCGIRRFISLCDAGLLLVFLLRSILVVIVHCNDFFRLFAFFHWILFFFRFRFLSGFLLHERAIRRGHLLIKLRQGLRFGLSVFIDLLVKRIQRLNYRLLLS